MNDQKLNQEKEWLKGALLSVNYMYFAWPLIQAIVFLLGLYFLESKILSYLQQPECFNNCFTKKFAQCCIWRGPIFPYFAVLGIYALLASFIFSRLTPKRKFRASAFLSVLSIIGCCIFFMVKGIPLTFAALNGVLLFFGIYIGYRIERALAV